MTVYNFSAGPAILPVPVMEQAQAELRDYQGTGVSILEMSHRSKEYEAINASAEARFKQLLGLESGYRVLFIPFKEGKPAGPAEDFLTGFIADESQLEVHGRPTGLAELPDGSLLVTDDAANTVWHVTASTASK